VGINRRPAKPAQIALLGLGRAINVVDAHPRTRLIAHGRQAGRRGRPITTTHMDWPPSARDSELQLLAPNASRGGTGNRHD
jgi:hypothetical protein